MKNVFVKTVLCLITTLIALIPTWMFYGGYEWANPQGFFQNLFILGMGTLFFGAAQIFCAIIGLCLILVIIAR